MTMAALRLRTLKQTRYSTVKNIVNSEGTSHCKTTTSSTSEIVLRKKLRRFKFVDIQNEPIKAQEQQLQVVDIAGFANCDSNRNKIQVPMIHENNASHPINTAGLSEKGHFKLSVVEPEIFQNSLPTKKLLTFIF